ncbi:MAG: hypothetical protein Q9164_004141, partial [Protoblastenia rupestris]
ISHIKLTKEESMQRYQSYGLPEFYAQFLSYLEAMTAGGGEERTDDSVEKVTGRPAQSFDAWIQEHKTAWQ